MRTIEEEWENYKKAVYPTNIPKDQERECRMAFYAGCACMFGLMNAAAEFEEDRAVKEVSKLHTEMNTFKLSVQNRQI